MHTFKGILLMDIFACFMARIVCIFYVYCFVPNCYASRLSFVDFTYKVIKILV